MAATVQIIEKNGAGGDTTDKTSLSVRFKDADNAAVDLNNRLRVPGSGQYTYSYEKWLRLRVTTAPSVDISHIVAYLDGGNGMGPGVDLYAKAVSAYATPVKPSSVTGWVDAFDYTQGSPLLLGEGPYNSWGSLPLEIGDHLVMMARLSDASSGGITPSETLVIAFDET